MKTYYQQLYSDINNVYLKILEKLKDLGETSHKFSSPVFLEYKVSFDEEDGEGNKMPIKSREVNITEIYIDTGFIFDFGIPHLTIKLKLSDGRDISIGELGLDNLYPLTEIPCRLERDLKDRITQRKEKIHFEGRDIIITDPCYILKDEKFKDTRDYSHKKMIFKRENWDMNNLTIEQIYLGEKEVLDENKRKMEEERKYNEEYEKTDIYKYSGGYNLEALGIPDSISRDTIYGDWGCTVYNSDTKEKIGEFCADTGMVAVMDLEQVLKYNPEFDYHLTKPWTTTLIKNFTGDIWFEVVETKGVYKEDTEYHKKGEEWIDHSLVIHGKGNINFTTRQTSL